ncbi:MAG: hypothetical protein DWQ10_17685 [Calditrichaeota bacterium]|nr:MAG: hypothetical protein DWQ10_17685 [Calditrichota bacterium]
MFVGKNNDFFNPNTKMWFVPQSDSRFGCVYFGKDDLYPISGMNEKGLVMEHFAGHEQAIKKSIGKRIFKGNIFDSIMATCSTVDQVLDSLDQFYLGVFYNGMVMFCDQTGNSVIVEGDTIIERKSFYQICTNIYQSEYEENNYPCWRYNTAEHFIKNHPDNFSFEFSRDVLNAIHQDITQISVIYDLINKKLEIYHFQEFSNPLSLDLKHEIQKGVQYYDLPELFPVNKKFQRTNYGKIIPQKNAGIVSSLVVTGLALLISIIVSIVQYFIGDRIKKGSLKKSKNGPVSATARIIALSLAILGLVYLITLSQYPQIFLIGLPDTLRDRMLIEKILIHIPALKAVLVFIASIVAVIIWKNGIWNNFQRWHYLSLIFLSSFLLFLYNYWGFIRIYW